LALTAGLTAISQYAAVTAVGVTAIGTSLVMSSGAAYAFANTSVNAAINFSTVLGAANAAVPGTTISVSTSVQAPIGAVITLTAPTGVGFQFAPTVTISQGTLTATGFSSGNNTVAYTLSVATISSGSPVAFSNINLSALNTYAATTTALSQGVGIGITSNVIGETASVASSAKIATFTAPLTIVASASAVNAVTIDVATGGTKVLAGTTDTTSISLGSVSFTNGASGNFDYDGVSSVFGKTTSGSITVTPGSLGFTGFTSVFASSTACSTTVPASGSAVPTTTSAAVTLTGLTISGTAAGVTTLNACGVINGTAVLQQSSYTLTGGAAVTSAVTTSAAVPSVAGTVAEANTSYSGTVSVNGFYVGSAGNSYASYENVVNTSSAAENVLFQATDPITGVSVVKAASATIPAGGSILYSPAMVTAAFGTAPFPAENNGKLTVLVSGNAIVQHLLYTPGSGVITETSVNSGVN